MKKSLLFVICILILSISFVSCSSDDNDDDGKNDTSATLYLNDTKENVSSILSGIYYTNKNAIEQPELSISLFGDEGSNLTSFSLTFPNVLLDNIKVGDDLVKLSDSETYMLLLYNEHGIFGIGEGSELEDGTPVYGTGSVTVKEFDQKKGFIRVELKDITVYHVKYPINGKSMKVRGEVGGIIDFTLYND